MFGSPREMFERVGNLKPFGLVVSRPLATTTTIVFSESIHLHFVDDYSATEVAEDLICLLAPLALLLHPPLLLSCWTGLSILYLRLPRFVSLLLARHADGEGQVHESLPRKRISTPCHPICTDASSLSVSVRGLSAGLQAAEAVGQTCH